ncbi:MAG: cyclic lactone autoinducer peptide [Desulfotomaculaceae bacterium]|nr:cyclic lactone autoinducer peptide [Desulfotomaculaceae bacterium]
MKYKIFSLLATLLLLLANVTSAWACLISTYQPEVPQSLRK